MDKTNRNIIIGCAVAAGVVVIVLIGIAVVGGFLFYGSYMKNPPQLKVPPALTTPRVLQGGNLLSKKAIFTSHAVGDVTGIAGGPGVAGSSTEIVGLSGAAVLDSKYKPLRLIFFQRQWSQVDIVDVEGDGVCEYLSRGSWSSPSTLIGHNGSILWTYRSGSGVDDTAAGDINGDGLLEFAVGFNGGDGIHLVDSKGKQVWRKPDGNVWHVEMVDTTGDGRPEIVHSNAAGQITIRDAKGNVISSAKPSEYFSSFCLCRWPAKGRQWLAVQGGNGRVYVIDLNGKTVSTLSAPYSDRFADPRSATVRLDKGKPEYLAVLLCNDKWDRLLLLLYDSTDALVYEECIEGSYGTVAASAPDKSGVQTLLVGSRGCVVQYRMVKP